VLGAGKSIALAILACAVAVYGQVGQCNCDPARPSTMTARECGLCREAEKQPASQPIFFLKDINPRKPNRWLVLPRDHGGERHSLAGVPSAGQAALWSAAIEKAKSMWGEKWGLAMNGDLTHTQCHPHIHIGRLIDEVETARFVVVEGPAAIPAPADGTGLWVHPQGGKLHVHLDEQLTETVLLR
jgi:hypothetical protein